VSARRRTAPWVGTLAAAVVTTVGAVAHGAELDLPRDGWVSWQVPAVENTRAWCCFSGWVNGVQKPAACKLDERSDGYNSRDDDATVDSIVVYARLNAGKLERLQALSPSCPVETKTPIRPLQDIGADDSARWLIDLAKVGGRDVPPHRDLGESALAALAAHRTELAGDALARFARTDARDEMRKRAVFWLALMRGERGAEITSSVMFDDAEPEVRKHAAFAMTLTKLPRMARDLMRQGNNDRDGDVRAQAWFWLAQTGVPEAEKAINAAMRQDASEHVREHAVFALSQLPEARATRALIAVAEDQSLSREQRRRAVFWLSQAESDSAQAYLEKVLASFTAR
jgi:HEAT repeat protein